MPRRRCGCWRVSTICRRTMPRLAAAALGVGADVPVCLDPRARIMRGIGDELSAPLDCRRCPRCWSIRAWRLRPATCSPACRRHVRRQPLRRVPREPRPFSIVSPSGNDLTEAAIACAPVVAEVLGALSALPGARFARMSGSGPTCFALLHRWPKLRRRREQLQAAHKDWWVARRTLIGPKPPLKMPPLAAEPLPSWCFAARQAGEENPMKFAFASRLLHRCARSCALTCPGRRGKPSDHGKRHAAQANCVDRPYDVFLGFPLVARQWAAPNGCAPPVHEGGDFSARIPTPMFACNCAATRTKAISRCTR